MIFGNYVCPGSNEFVSLLPSKGRLSDIVTNSLNLAQLPAILLRPGEAFEQFAESPPTPTKVFLQASLWLGLMPPVFAFFGMSRFGWRLGTVEPVTLSWQITLWISLAYFGCLLFGFLSTAYLARWMAQTYGATRDSGAHFALLTVVGAPLTVGSVMHLYPHILLNLLVLVPCLIWGVYLLYRGLPTVLKTTPEQGFLMASSLVGYLLVAFVSLLGISAFLWTQGIGPRIGA